MILNFQVSFKLKMDLTGLTETKSNDMGMPQLSKNIITGFTVDVRMDYGTYNRFVTECNHDTMFNVIKVNPVFQVQVRNIMNEIAETERKVGLPQLPKFGNLQFGQGFPVMPPIFNNLVEKEAPSK